MNPSTVWEVWVGFQTPEDFVANIAKSVTIKAAVDEYVNAVWQDVSEGDDFGGDLNEVAAALLTFIKEETS
jgi:hypothetical protein